MTYRARWWAGVCLFMAVICTSAGALYAQQGGSTGVAVVEGRVVDDATGDPLPGASVTVMGRAIATATDANGTYRLPGVPIGDQKIVVSYVGRSDLFLDAHVTAAGISRIDARMKLTGFEETVTVQGSLIRDAEERALNQQKTAPNITNVVSADRIGSFPDKNAAEVTQRIPGISITKDQGEGRYVIVRGTEPRLNSMMLNGERIPSPDPLFRQVAIDVIPSELLQSIEVSKSLTPDMDADSIGGSVNLITKAAPDKLRILGAFGGGYNQLLNDWNQSNFSATAGRRVDGGKIGILFSGSSSVTHRATQDMEATYTPTLTLGELNPRYYQVNRRRWGLNGTMDVKTGNNGAFTIRGLYNRFIDDHENRQRVRWNVA